MSGLFNASLASALAFSSKGLQLRLILISGLKQQFQLHCRKKHLQKELPAIIVSVLESLVPSAMSEIKPENSADSPVYVAGSGSYR